MNKLGIGILSHAHGHANRHVDADDHAVADGAQGNVGLLLGQKQGLLGLLQGGDIP